MTNDSFFHGDCGGSLSLWGGLIYCRNCGHIPVEIRPEIDSADLTVWLPYLKEAGIIAKTDFHGLVLKQI